jgi:hypothetical protein
VSSTLARWNYLPDTKPHDTEAEPEIMAQAVAHTDDLRHPARAGHATTQARTARLIPTRLIIRPERCHS